MSSSRTYTRVREIRSTSIYVDEDDLKSVRVSLKWDADEPYRFDPVLRSLDNPFQLEVHIEPDEGVRPIFDRDDVIVNQENAKERIILTLPKPRKDRVLSRVRRSRSKSPERLEKIDKTRLSPEPSSSRDHSKDSYGNKSRYHPSSSVSEKTVHKFSSPNSRRSRTPPYPSSGYKRRRKTPPSESVRGRTPQRLRSERERTPKPRGGERERTPPKYYNRQRSSRSPNIHKGPLSERRHSRSPHARMPERARTPPKYRGPDRKRSRSPPPRRSSRGRSRSYSPHYRRSRYSRSPHRYDDRRYDRSKRSRSPRRRYTPDRHSRRSPHDDRMYDPSRMPPNPYFERPEFWVPNPMLHPRFIPGQMIPPGVFPYPFRPRLPPMIPPRMPFGPRTVYNRPSRPRTAQPAAITTGESSTVTTTTTTAGTTEGEKTEQTDQTVTITECTDNSGNTDNDQKHSSNEANTG